MADDNFYIGLSTSEIYDFFPLDVWFSNLNIPVAPDWTFAPYSEQITKANAGVAGVGFPRASWTWKFRNDKQIEVLRALCPGASAAVYIRTPTNEVDLYGSPVWATFSCQMIWVAIDEDKQAGYTLDFTLEFRRLVLIP
jgi:hypothetical protein